jgi:intracellular sulfur oxidation DsrE/DsrF family protein
MMADKHHARDAASARRGFLGRIIAGAAGLVAVGSTPRLLDAATAAGSGGSPFAAPGDDWMKALTAPHRTVFDITAHKNGKPLLQAMNFLNGWRDAFKTPEHDVNLVMGVHGEAAPLLLNDGLWERYKIGQQYEVTDGATKSAAVRNVFTSAHAAAAGLVAPEQSIETLQQRGVRFIICMNTIANTTKKLAAAGLGAPDEIHAAILAGLLPGTITVPAINVALAQLQEHGVKYEKID